MSLKAWCVWGGGGSVWACVSNAQGHHLLQRAQATVSSQPGAASWRLPRPTSLAPVAHQAMTLRPAFLCRGETVCSCACTICPRFSIMLGLMTGLLTTRRCLEENHFPSLLGWAQRVFGQLHCDSRDLGDGFHC